MRLEKEIQSIIEKIYKIKTNSINSFEDRVIFIGKNFLLDLSIEEKCLNLETIVIPKEQRNKGLTKLFIKELLELTKNDDNLNKFKISAIIYSGLANMCKNMNFVHEDFNYPPFDIKEYESFDGYYGSYYKII